MTRLPRITPTGVPTGRPAGRNGGGEAARGGAWLLTFTDLICLMLTFFVMTYAMREPEAERWATLANALSQSARSTATAPGDRDPVPAAPFNAATLETHSAVNLNYLAAILRTQIAGSDELAGIAVRREDDRLVIAIPGDRLFDADGTVFSDGGRRALFLLGAVVGRIGNRIEVVGRAEGEDAPAGHAWDRALGRAAAVAMALRETGYRRDLVARATMGDEADGASAGPQVDVVVRDQWEG
ncbi:flagellar motor protein MotB [Azospirillum halopraeferens]|uniref:flagellar motor protein MotB n=1 Tax=Azospirillum halopraeferens TaxID=34010 RepID=UPI0004010C6A|nr:flagellar motor protein MotB [Azospirillum halopraeferens]